MLHARSKHIELDLYFVREKVMKKEIEVTHVASLDQLVDFFTKAIPSAQFNSMRFKLRVVEISQPKFEGEC